MPGSASWSTGKLVGVGLAGLLAIGGLLTLAERLVGAPPSTAAPPRDANTDEATGIEAPEIIRVSPTEVRIHYGVHRSTVRFDPANGEDGDRLVECLEQGFAQAVERAESDPGARSDTTWVERQFEESPLVREFNRVREECFKEMIGRRSGMIDLPRP